MTLVGRDSALAEQSVAALAFYVGVYLFMNLGAFAVVAFLRNAMRSEEIADYAGLIRHSPRAGGLFFDDLDQLDRAAVFQRIYRQVAGFLLPWCRPSCTGCWPSAV